MPKSEKSRVQINYKSGLSVVFECDKFAIKGAAGSRSMEWEAAVPRPMLLGINEIESVWELNP